MACTTSRAASRGTLVSVSPLESPASGTPSPTRTTRTQDSVPAQQGEDSPEPNVLPGFLKAHSPTALTDNVYVILGHGRYQLFVASSFVLSGCMLIAHVLAYQLIGRRVGHWCKRPDYLRHLSQEAWRNVAIPLLPDGTFSGCTVYDPPVEGEGAERPEVPCREWDYDDEGYPDSIVSMWNLVCDRQWLYQFSFILYMIGPVFSAPVAGALADRFGRRPVIITLLWAFSFASMVSAVANSFFMFLMARLVTSATSYAAFALLFILLYEVTDNEHRAILAFVSSAVVLTLSPPVLNVVSRMKPSWYLAHTILAAPTVLLAALSSLIQESPIWLLASGMTQQALQNILKTARMNGMDLVRAKVTFKALKVHIKTDEEAASTPASWSKTTPLSFLFSGGSGLSAALSWFTLTLALYVLFLPSSTKPWFEEATYIVLETLFHFAICCYMRRKGYRHALWVSLILLCVFWALFVVLNIVGYPRVISHLTMLAQQATHSAVTINYCFTAEAFPAAVRAKGFFFSAFIGRLGGLLATLMRLNPGRTTTMLAHMVFSLLALLTAIGVQWLPELVFFKKEKTKQVASPEVMSEKQRKEMIKASLSPRKMSTTTRIRSPRPRSDKPRARSLKRGSPSLMDAKSRKSEESLQPQYGSTKTNSPKFVQSR